MTYATLGVFYLHMNFEILLFVAGCVSMRYYITFNVRNRPSIIQISEELVYIEK